MGASGLQGHCCGRSPKGGEPQEGNRAREGSGAQKGSGSQEGSGAQMGDRPLRPTYCSGCGEARDTLAGIVRCGGTWNCSGLWAYCSECSQERHLMSNLNGAQAMCLLSQELRRLACSWRAGLQAGYLESLAMQLAANINAMSTKRRALAETILQANCNQQDMPHQASVN